MSHEIDDIFHVGLVAAVLAGCVPSNPGGSEGGSGGSTASTTVTDPSVTTTTGGTTGAGETATDAGHLASERCVAFCAQHTACSDFVAPNCLEMCDATLGIYVDSTEDCRQAVEAGFDCMAGAACQGWNASPLAGGECWKAVWEDQLAVCRGPGYFPGWDACASVCHHALVECAVDVPNVSTYLSYTNCFYECKLNRGFDVSLGCIETAFPGMACELALECDVLEAFLNGDDAAAPECAALFEEHASACGG